MQTPTTSTTPLTPFTPHTPPALVLCELTDPAVDGLESYSPFCLKVHRALRAAGLSYERRHEANPGAFRALNPTGQVPVLLVDGEPVFDSTRILARIETLAIVPLSRSSDVAARAEAWLWEELADTSLNGFLVAARWADDRNDMALLAAQSVGLGDAVRVGQRGAGVGVLDEVVLGLRSARIARQTALFAQGAEAGLAPGDDLVDVGLVPGVPQDAVARAVEDAVQRKRHFHDAERSTRC